MDNNLTLIIIGLYTLIYVIVFIIQKSQIEKIKEANLAMKSFMDLFDLKKVSDYVDILDKRADLKNEIVKKEYDEKFISEKFIPFTKEAIDKIQQDVHDYYNPKLNELKSYVLSDILLKNPTNKEDKIKYIDDNFKETKDEFIFLIEKIYNDKTS